MGLQVKSILMLHDFNNYYQIGLLLTDIIFAIDIMFIHEFKQLDFNLSLIEEWLLVLDDLDRNLFLINKVIRFDHLHRNIIRIVIINKD